MIFEWPHPYFDCLYDKKEAVWVAELDDGTKVYQDDHLEGTGAWDRLREYCQTHQKKLVSLHLKFWDHETEKFTNQPGTTPISAFYFKRGLLAFIQGGDAIYYYSIGVLRGETVYITKYHVPSLVLFESESRPLSETDPKGLIYEVKIH